MSLSRLALRLAAVEMLCPSASSTAGGPYPTWAGSNVYDSRVDPISDADGWREFVASVEGKPIVTLYTEEHDTSPVTGDYPAEIEIVDLVVEIMIAVGGVLVLEDGTEIGTLDAPITEPMHEATLDLVEHQVRSLLDPNGPEPADSNAAAARLIYLKVARELHHIKSVPMRDAANRLSRQAARTLTFKIRTPHPQFVAAPAGTDPALASLPEPLLSVALALPVDSAAGDLVRLIAQGAPPPAAPVPLRDVRIFTSVDRGVAPGEGDADLVSDLPL